MSECSFTRFLFCSLSNGISQCVFLNLPVQLHREPSMVFLIILHLFHSMSWIWKAIILEFIKSISFFSIYDELNMLSHSFQTQPFLSSQYSLQISKFLLVWHWSQVAWGRISSSDGSTYWLALWNCPMFIFLRHPLFIIFTVFSNSSSNENTLQISFINSRAGLVGCMYDPSLGLKCQPSLSCLISSNL